jgi:hypothetical protein
MPRLLTAPPRADLSHSEFVYAWANAGTSGVAIGAHNVAVTWRNGPVEAVVLVLVSSFPLKKLFEFARAPVRRAAWASLRQDFVQEFGFPINMCRP